MLEINISTRDLDRIAADFVATEKQAERALRSTLGKMAKWVKTRSIRGLSKELSMPQKVLRRRIKTLKARKTTVGSEISIWYGENPVGLIYLGAKKSGNGIAAQGGRKVAGGFIAKGKGGKQDVFKRNGASRLPIKRQAAEVQPDANKYLESEFIAAAEFEIQFHKVFEHEMQWQTRT